MIEMKEWDGFEGRLWKEEINVRQFIQDNYTPYDGDESFLADPTDATNKLWDALQKLQKEERAKGGVLDMETEVVTGITAYGPGYIDESLKDLEQIVGLQTDKPLKRAFMPYGGIKMAVQAAETYGYNVSDKLKEIFTKYHKTHNTAVFDAYTPEMMKVRHAKILTGLPDTYGRGRIVGDYRRVALYGLDYLIEEKKKDKANCGCGQMTDDVIRLREEIAEQIKCLEDMKKLAEIYGYDISRPATNAKEAVQWLYFGYLAAIKTQNGAAMSVGRVSTFLDIYIKRDMDKGILISGQIFKISTVHLRTYVTNMFLDFPNTFSRPSFPSEETDVTGIRLRIVCTDKAQQSRFPSTVLTTQRPLLTTTDCPVQFFQNSSVAITDTNLIKFYYFLRIVIVAIR